MNNARIAFRNLNRQKKRSFLLGGAIAFGLMIIIMLTAFTAGVVVNVRQNGSLLLAGHIFLIGMEKTESGMVTNVIRDDTFIRDTLKELDIEVKSIAKCSSFTGTLIFEDEYLQQKIDGIEPEKEENLKERLVLKEGTFDALSSDPRALIISEKVATQLNAAVGDNILVKLTTSTGQVNVGEFILKGISIDPGMMGFSGCYANLEYVNELLNIGRNESTLLGIFLNDFKKIDIEMDRLYTALSQKVNLFERTSDKEGFASLRGGSIEGEWEGMKYQLLSINDLLSRLNQLSDILNIVGVVVLLILLLIIMVGITNTFRMIIHERIREIGTMRALGMQRNGVRNIFLFEAFFLSLGGAAAGFLAALIIMFCVSLIEFGMGPLFIVMKNGHFYFNIIPAQVILYFALVAGMTLAAAFIPARKAARIDPAHALRTIY